MNKTFGVVLMALGGLFVAVVIVGAGFYFVVVRSGGVMEYTPKVTQPAPQNTTATTSTSTQTQNTSFVLSSAQKQALTAFGIDPNAVPSTITPAQEACFIAQLGAPRVTEIRAGAVPSMMEFLKVKVCI